MEDQVKDLMYSGISVDLLVPSPIDDAGQVGVRLRTIGRDLPPKRMIVAEAGCFSDALEAAIGKAEAGRWEHLDWAARPWHVAPTVSRNAAARWGFV